MQGLGRINCDRSLACLLAFLLAWLIERFVDNSRRRIFLALPLQSLQTGLYAHEKHEQYGSSAVARLVPNHSGAPSCVDAYMTIMARNPPAATDCTVTGVVSTPIARLRPRERESHHDTAPRGPSVTSFAVERSGTPRHDFRLAGDLGLSSSPPEFIGVPH